MKKTFLFFPIIFSFIFLLSGCGVVGNEDISLSIIYAICSVLSLLILSAYCCLQKKRNKWYLTMFVSVLVVNIGYFALSCSTSLTQALIANGISYLGSVFLPMAMFMIILNVTNLSYKKWLPWVLFVVGVIVFLIASSPGYSTVYYKDVTFEMVDGIGTLKKVYGPLHILYLFYLLLYFGCMISAIVQSFVKKTADSLVHSVIVALAVFVNLAVWFLEQFMNNRFEFLSVSYIISELFLLGLTIAMHEHQKLKEMVRVKQLVDTVDSPQHIQSSLVVTDVLPYDMEAIELFVSGYQQLTKTEKSVFNGYVNRLTTKEVMTTLNITENTLKFHNKNLYGKLGVSSRKQLMLLYEQVKTVKGTFEQ